MTTLTPRKAVVIPVKPMKGTIKNVEVVQRELKDGTPVAYAEIKVQTTEKQEGWNGVMTLSMPADITQNTQLGKLLSNLGFEYEPDEDFELDELAGTEIAFNTKRDGNFTVIVPETIRVVGA